MDNPIIHYRIAGIELVEKIMHRSPVDAPIAQFLYDVRVETKVSAPNHLVLGYVHITIRAAEHVANLASIGVSCLFDIEDFDKHIVLQKSGLYLVPPVLEHSIRPLSISTARGVMYSEFRGTHLNNAVLPVIDISSFISNDPQAASK
jgi:hypothetical protein